MTAIRIVFPWGRYYAHPWGLNPTSLRNAEWPPSPWRLLRALVSAWHQTYPGKSLNQDATGAIQCLASKLPEIGFCKLTFAFTIHYQPNFGEAKTGKPEVARARMAVGDYKKTRHENYFAAVHGPVVFRWADVEPSPAESAILAEMLAGMSYFGRAESICLAEPIADDEIEALDGIGWCRPTSGRKISPECRDVFCPNPADFRVTDLWARRADNHSLDSGDAPAHLVDALLSSDMKTDGGSWFSYQMPEDWPSHRVVRTPKTARRQHIAANGGPRIAHYLRFSLQCRVPIHPKFTVPLAERFRAAASRHFQKRFGSAQTSFALFGHLQDRPEDAKGEHQHAFYLPTRDLDAPPRPGVGNSITELHVWCPYGFTQSEIQVLQNVQRLYWRDGRYPVRPVLVAIGLEPPRGAQLGFGAVRSSRWQTETPFIPPRHFYRTGRGGYRVRQAESPECQLAACLRQAGILEAVEVRRLTLTGRKAERLKSLPPMPHWTIARSREDPEADFAGAVTSATHAQGESLGAYGQRIGFFMEIAFDSEVALPMPSFGHSNHFGLGLFVAALSADVG